MGLEESCDQKALEEAHGALENPSWIAELSNLIGKPAEWLIDHLPKKIHGTISRATTAALKRALTIALGTMDIRHKGPASRWWHRTAVTITGGVGGFFGLLGLSFELPVTTTIMLRSIADIARSQGEHLEDTEARLACIEVFALGGHSPTDDASESGYFATRAALAKAVSSVATYVVEKGAAEETAPVILRLVESVAQRFAPTVAEKVAAEAVPVVGAIGGATVNLLFTNHFQKVAQGHFTIRRLERKYGADRVRREYDGIPV